MALTIEQIAYKVDGLKRRYVARDSRMADVLAVRQGNMAGVFPDMFPEGFSKPMVANFVDIAARDIAEVIAPLPSFNCSVVNVTSDNAKKFADKRTLIANNYVNFSRLQTQMYQGADWYLSYGFLPIVVEPDEQAGMPRIRVENPLGAYPEFDRYKRCVSYTKRYIKSLGELVAEFPEFESQLIGRSATRETADYGKPVELVHYQDKDVHVLFIPERNNLVLRTTDNPTGELMVRVATRPGIDDEARGQFDDVIWVQLARARFSLLAMEAVEKSVQAPLALPDDVDEFAFGPDAIIRSRNPQQIRRVGLDLPTGAFTEQSLLAQELRLGSRFPEGRTGNIDASVITGQGVQALLGGFDTQIKTAQTILTDLFEEVISLCFRTDEKLFDDKKSVKGTFQGAPYEISYIPTKDIKGDYSVEVRYGLMSGLDPSRALIFSLQALGANLISRDFVMRELPWSMNVSMEQERIDIEKMRDSLNASIAALAQAIPAMASQGQDPSEMVEKIARVIDARRKGSAIEDAVMDVFEKPEPEQIAPEMQTAPGVEEGMQEPGMASPQGTPPGAPPPDLGAILSQLGA